MYIYYCYLHESNRVDWLTSHPVDIFVIYLIINMYYTNSYTVIYSTSVLNFVGYIQREKKIIDRERVQRHYCSSIYYIEFGLKMYGLLWRTFTWSTTGRQSRCSYNQSQLADSSSAKRPRENHWRTSQKIDIYLTIYIPISNKLKEGN